MEGFNSYERIYISSLVLKGGWGSAVSGSGSTVFLHLGDIRLEGLNSCQRIYISSPERGCESAVSGSGLTVFLHLGDIRIGRVKFLRKNLCKFSGFERGLGIRCVRQRIRRFSALRRYSLGRIQFLSKNLCKFSPPAKGVGCLLCPAANTRFLHLGVIQDWRVSFC